MAPEKFDQAMSKAAHVAADACWHAMQEMASGRVVDEDDATGVLVGEINAALRGSIGGIVWKAKILRHRQGVAGEEKKYGADMLFHLKYQDAERQFAKGVLVQAKKVEPNERMRPTEHSRLIKQCNTMLDHTPSSYVFNYASAGVRVSSANKISGLMARDLHANCEWTAYRFFYEFFRCPVGDRAVTTTHISGVPIVGDKAAADGGPPIVVKLDAFGMD